MLKIQLSAIVALVALGCGNTTPHGSTLDAPRGSTDAAQGDAGSDAAIQGYGPYGGDGPSAGTSFTASIARGTNSPFTVTVYLPSGPGPFPAVMLSSGLQQPGAAYAPYATRLSSWGVITILRDDPGVFANTSDLVLDVSYIATTWLPAENADASSQLYRKVDTTNVGLAGHSRGGYVSLMSAEAGALGHIKGVFGLDPVDTSPTAGAALATVGVPLAFIGETTDSTGTNACAPAADNYQALYGDAASPIVEITAIHGDHTMFEDPASCSLCSLCTAGTANQSAVLAYSVRYMTAFFARVLENDTSVGATFEGAGSSLDVAAGSISLASK